MVSKKLEGKRTRVEITKVSRVCSGEFSIESAESYGRICDACNAEEHLSNTPISRLSLGGDSFLTLCMKHLEVLRDVVDAYIEEETHAN